MFVFRRLCSALLKHLLLKSTAVVISRRVKTACASPRQCAFDLLEGDHQIGDTGRDDFLTTQYGGFANRISEASTEPGHGRVRESKNNGASFRKSILKVSLTGREPNKIFGSVLWSAAVPRSFSIVFGPSTVTVMPVQILPKLAKLQVCFQKSSCGG